ncbi:MAG: hypothetical protein QGF98_06785, partial [Candidatus Poseidoniia archaeon]|nr:hypothetical protein [Candidatus Poseidoniia archaeon]
MRKTLLIITALMLVVGCGSSEKEPEEETKAEEQAAVEKEPEEETKAEEQAAVEKEPEKKPKGKVFG